MCPLQGTTTELGEAWNQSVESGDEPYQHDSSLVGCLTAVNFAMGSPVTSLFPLLPLLAVKETLAIPC